MSPRPMPLQQASSHLQHASTHLQEPYKRRKTASLRLATRTQVDENIGVTDEPARSTNSSSSYGPADHSFHRRKSKNKTTLHSSSRNEHLLLHQPPPHQRPRIAYHFGTTAPAVRSHGVSSPQAILPRGRTSFQIRNSLTAQKKMKRTLQE
jgi:hypothetical protein